MSIIYADRAQVVTVTTGTGNYTLGAAVTGFQAIADITGISDGDQFYYAANDDNNWEIGLGTWTLATDTVARTLVLKSSNSNSAVSWAAGDKNFFITLPADLIVDLSTAQSLSNKTLASPNITGDLTMNVVGQRISHALIGQDEDAHIELNNASGNMVLGAGGDLVLTSGVALDGNVVLKKGAIEIMNLSDTSILITQGVTTFTYGSGSAPYQTVTTNASFAGVVQDLVISRASSAAFNYFAGRASFGSDWDFRLRGDGNGLCDGSWTGGGADYAEYFEWEDGNPDEEDRVGYPVILINDKIRIALPGEVNLLGIVSGMPSMVGDGDTGVWKEKYLKDDFGRYLFEPYTSVSWEERIQTIDKDERVNIKTIPHSYESDKCELEIPDDAIYSDIEEDGSPLERKVINPDYDPDKEFVSRENRKEWDTIGLMGKVRLRKGQPVNNNWIKMKNISDSVEQWFIK